jgi:hypothetical protein
MADPRAKPPTVNVSVTIPAGQTVSNSADLSAGNMVMLLTPDDWTPANISFLVSEDNVKFRNLYDSNGMEIVKTMAPGRAINVDSSLTSGSMWIKLCSGSSTNPILQEEDRVFVIIVQ